MWLPWCHILTETWVAVGESPNDVNPRMCANSNAVLNCYTVTKVAKFSRGDFFLEWRVREKLLKP